MKLSILICAFDMQRELPRTIFSLSPEVQNDVVADDYEIIVVDNGSTVPIEEGMLQQIAPNVRLIRFEPGNVSPAKAINTAMRSAQGNCLALFIDGARLASPGIISAALKAYRSDRTKIVGTLSFHLGPDVQMRSMNAGYGQDIEDDLLAASRWKEDGYALFDISVLAGSALEGWFGHVKESNGVFMDADIWKKLGGLDERFEQPGGGVVNLDFWKRAVALSDNAPWIVLGEGTFHQIHGGAAANGTRDDRAAMFMEFEDIHGEPIYLPPFNALYVGTLSEKLIRFSGDDSGPRQRQAHSIFGRKFSVGVPKDLLESVQSGTMKSSYRGRKFLKNPFDLGLYMRLVQQLQPQTIIEIGTSEGGSACWFRDICKSLDIECDILTLDICEPDVPIENVSFFQADSTKPNETFPHVQIAEAAHPVLVIEDSAHSYDSVRAVLEYFDPHLVSGDYIVVEDGVVADLSAQKYKNYDDGPNRAVRDFLLESSDRYKIDTGLCDFYGRNATYCPNGWLVRQ